MFLTSLKQICNEYLIKFSENQSAPKLENRKTSPCSPCAPNLLHVLMSRTTGYHNLCSPVGDICKNINEKLSNTKRSFCKDSNVLCLILMLNVSDSLSQARCPIFFLPQNPLFQVFFLRPLFPAFELLQTPWCDSVSRFRLFFVLAQASPQCTPCSFVCSILGEHIRRRRGR